MNEKHSRHPFPLLHVSVEGGGGDLVVSHREECERDHKNRFIADGGVVPGIFWCCRGKRDGGCRQTRPRTKRFLPIVVVFFLLRPKTFTLLSPKNNDVVNVHHLRVTGQLIAENRDLGFAHPIY